MFFSKNYFTVKARDLEFVNVTEFEFTTGIEKYRKSDYMPEIGSVPFKVSYGLMQNFEVGVKLPYSFFRNSDDGLSDLYLYQKFRFIEESADFPMISGGFGLEFPTGEFKSDSIPSFNNKVDFDLFIGAGKLFKNYGNLYLSTIIGVNFIGGGDYTQFEYNLCASKEFTSKIKLSLELNGEKNKLYNNLYLTPGIILKPLETLGLKFGTPFGLSDDAYDYGFILNISNTF